MATIDIAMDLLRARKLQELMLEAHSVNLRGQYDFAAAVTRDHDQDAPSVVFIDRNSADEGLLVRFDGKQETLERAEAERRFSEGESLSLSASIGTYRPNTAPTKDGLYSVPQAQGPARAYMRAEGVWREVIDGAVTPPVQAPILPMEYLGPPVPFIKEIKQEPSTAPTELQLSDWFYGDLRAVLAQKLPARSTGLHYAQMLRKAPASWGLKGSALRWLGLADYAEGFGKTRIEADTLLNFVDMHDAPLLEEVIDGGDVRFSSQIVGDAGSNYREVVIRGPQLTDPQQSPNRADYRMEARKVSGGDMVFTLTNSDADVSHEIARGRATSMDEAWTAFLEDAKSGLVDGVDLALKDLNGHWETENVLVHARISDMPAADPDEGPVMVVEEIQSDIHQQSRLNPDEAKNAPFQRNWAQLAFKRLLILGAQQGYSGIALVNGEQQQAANPNMGEITHLTYDIPGGFATVIRRFDGVSTESLDIEELEKEFGVAGKMLAGQAESARFNANRYELLEEDDGTWAIYLDGEFVPNIGTEHMCYDDEPTAQEALQLLKDEYLQQTPVGVNLQIERDLGNLPEEPRSGLAHYYDEILPRQVMTTAQLVDSSVTWGSHRMEDTALPLIPITPKMRVELSEGQPKFSTAIAQQGPANTVESVIAELRTRFGDAAEALLDSGKVAVVQSVADLPEALRPSDMGNSYAGRVFYRGEHTLDFGHPFENTEGRLPTFTDSPETASVYATAPNNEQHMGSQPRVLMTRLSASWPLSLCAPYDPFVEVDRLVDVFGEARTRTILRKIVTEDGAHSFTDEFLDQAAGNWDIDEIIEQALLQRPAITAYRVADLPEVAQFAAETGHDAIEIWGITHGEAVAEFRVLRPEQVLSIDGQQFSVAYHGGEVFDEFDMSYVGQGTGVTVRGHGIYAGDVIETADFYRQLNATDITIYDAQNTPIAIDTEDEAAALAVNFLKAAKGDLQIAMSDLERAEIRESGEPQLADARAYLRGLQATGHRVERTGGQVYKLEIPDESRMLGWDIPIAEQTPIVKERVAALTNALFTGDQSAFNDWVVENYPDEAARWDGLLPGRQVYLASTYANSTNDELPNVFMRDADSLTGGMLYRVLKERLGSEKAASLHLRDNGIPGNWFEPTRKIDGQEVGKKNYVVFDESAVRIVDRIAPDGQAQYSLAAVERNHDTTVSMRGLAVGVHLDDQNAYSTHRRYRAVFKELLNHLPMTSAEVAVLDAIRPVIERWNGTPKSDVIYRALAEHPSATTSRADREDTYRSLLVEASTRASLRYQQDVLIDWDKPYQEQSDNVKLALSEMGLNPFEFKAPAEKSALGVVGVNQMTGAVITEQADGSYQLTDGSGSVLETTQTGGLEALESLIEGYNVDRWPPGGPTGKEFYQHLTETRRSPYRASLEMLSAGIDGIRHRETTGMSGDGFVLFDDGRSLYSESPMQAVSRHTPKPTVQGVWDGSRAYLVADHIAPGEAPGVLLHEVGEHAGMREMLNDRYEDLVSEFDRLLVAGDPYAALASALVPTSTPKPHLPSERLAYLIELVENREFLHERYDHVPALSALVQGLPETPSNPITRLVKTAVSEVKAWAWRQPALQKLAAMIPGVPPISLDAHDIAALAHQSLRYQARALAETDIVPSATLQYSMQADLFADNAPAQPLTNDDLLQKIDVMRHGLAGVMDEQSYRDSLDQVAKGINEGAAADLYQVERELDLLAREIAELPTQQQADEMRAKEEQAALEREQLLRETGDLSQPITNLRDILTDSLDLAHLAVCEKAGIDYTSAVRQVEGQRALLNARGVYDTSQLQDLYGGLPVSGLSKLVQLQSNVVLGIPPYDDLRETESRFGVQSVEALMLSRSTALDPETQRFAGPDTYAQRREYGDVFDVPSKDGSPSVAVRRDDQGQWHGLIGTTWIPQAELPGEIAMSLEDALAENALTAREAPLIVPDESSEIAAQAVAALLERSEGLPPAAILDEAPVHLRYDVAEALLQAAEPGESDSLWSAIYDRALFDRDLDIRALALTAHAQDWARDYKVEQQLEQDGFVVAKGLTPDFNGGDVIYTLGKSSKHEGQWQVTRLDSLGPSSDSQHTDLQDAVAAIARNAVPLEKELGELELQNVSLRGVATAEAMQAWLDVHAGPTDELNMLARRVSVLGDTPENLSESALQGALNALVWAEDADRLNANLKRVMLSSDSAVWQPFLVDLALDVQQGDAFAWLESATRLSEKLDPSRLPALNEEPLRGVSDQKIDDNTDAVSGMRDAIYNVRFKLLIDLPSKVDEITKTTHFPTMNYAKLLEAGVPKENLAAISVIRDQIPAKPPKNLVGSSRKRDLWLEEFVAAREAAATLLDMGNQGISISDVLAKMDKRGNHGEKMQWQIDALLALDFPAVTSLGKFGIGRGHTLYMNGVRLAQPVETWTVTKQRGRYTRPIKHAETWDEVLGALREQVGLSAKQATTQRQKAQTRFLLYRKASEESITIGVKVSGKYIDLRSGFEDGRSAREYVQNNRSALEDEWVRRKKGPEMRPETNQPRAGDDHRQGQDITLDQFKAAFGFRGPRFGKSVTQKRRQQDLNNAYDALMDMAGVIGVPSQALSLNGSLGLSFGALGMPQHRAAAHYEPGHVVINLTKRHGAGSLGHEWWHAVDNYLSKQGGRTSYLSEHAPLVGTDVLQDGLVERFSELREAISSSDMKRRSVVADMPRKKDYFSTEREMSARAFERFLRDELEARGIKNDYLANFYDAKGAEVPEDYPYPTKDEAVIINQAYSKVFDTMKYESTDKGMRLYSTGVEEFTEETPETIREALQSRFGDLVGRLEQRGVLKIVNDAEEIPFPYAGPLPLLTPEQAQMDWDPVAHDKGGPGGNAVSDAVTGRPLNHPVWARNRATGEIRPFALSTLADVRGETPRKLAASIGRLNVLPTLALAAPTPAVAIENAIARCHETAAHCQLLEREGRYIALSPLAPDYTVFVSEGWQVSPSTISADARNTLAGMVGPSPAGVYQGGVAYLVANKLTKATAPGVLLHEIGEHAAMPSMLADYDDLVSQFDQLLRRRDPYAVLADAMVPNATPPEDVNSERLAYLVEIVENRHALPQRFENNVAMSHLVANLPKPSRGVWGLVKQTVANLKAHVYASPMYQNHIKPVLGSFGFKLNAADISALAHRALRGYADGTIPAVMSNAAKYSFAGEQAVGADLSALDDAKRMQKRGMRETEIWQTTGWFKDVDDRWKFEIDDTNAHLRADALMTQGSLADLPTYTHTASLRSAIGDALEEQQSLAAVRFGEGSPSSLLDHEPLLNAYDLESVWTSIGIDERGAGWVQGFKDDGLGMINKPHVVVGASTENLATDTLLHEYQHVIQDIEDFSPGGNPVTAKDELLDDLKAELADYRFAKDAYSMASTAARVAKKFIQYKVLEDIAESPNPASRVDEIMDLPVASVQANTLRARYQVLRQDSAGSRAKRHSKDPAQISDIDAMQARALAHDLCSQITTDISATSHGDRYAESVWQHLSANPEERYEYLLDSLRREARLKEAVVRRNELVSQIDGVEALPAEVVYHRLAGEVEARNVERRRTLTPEQRLYTHPARTRDVEPDNILVLPTEAAVRQRMRAKGDLLRHKKALTDLMAPEFSTPPPKAAPSVPELKLFASKESQLVDSVVAMDRAVKMGVIAKDDIPNLATASSLTEYVLVKDGLAALPERHQSQIAAAVAAVAGPHLDARDRRRLSSVEGTEALLVDIHDGKIPLNDLSSGILEEHVQAILSDVGMGKHDVNFRHPAASVLSERARLMNGIDFGSLDDLEVEPTTQRHVGIGL